MSVCCQLHCMGGLDEAGVSGACLDIVEILLVVQVYIIVYGPSAPLSLRHC